MSQSTHAQPAQPDWRAWSREAVHLVQERNARWLRDYGLEDRRYHWRFADAQLVFPSEGASVIADICVIGSISVSEGTFLWAWANPAIPAHAWRGLERVREFGQRNALELLIKPEWPGDRSDALEAAAVAGRVLDADGIWIAPTGDVTLFFALTNLRKVPDVADRGDRAA
jgi:hypothetical protein